MPNNGLKLGKKIKKGDKAYFNYSNYTSPIGTSFDHNFKILFDNFTYIYRRTSVENYKLIIEFINRYIKLPSKDSKDIYERKLGTILSYYKNGKNKELHVEFILKIEQLCKILGISSKHNVEDNQKNILGFIVENNRPPSQGSKNIYERKLAQFLNSYKHPKRRHRYIEFLKQVEDLLKEINYGK